tara:strand:+ start:75 stop:350 length:276 start_codon:yes stop_codon:yes gene_type:complete
MKLLEKIEYLLKQHLDIKKLIIEDESHKHAGHIQNQNAGGHFKALIISKSFDDLPLINRHKLVYKALGNLIGKEIHAFSMKTISEKEKNND